MEVPPRVSPAGSGNTARSALGGGSLAAALQTSDVPFRLLVETVADYAIFMLDPTGHVISWNRGAQRIKGYTEEQIVGKHFSIFYTDEDRARRFPEHELEVASAAGRYEDEGWRIRQDGTRFWANVVITALRDGDGRLLGFAKVTRDLTERVKADAERQALERERRARIEAEELAQEVAAQASNLEEQALELEFLNDRLQEANTQLSARSDEAERAREAAEAADRAKSEFLANMSHELRTPLNAILGYGELLEMGIAGPLTEPQAAHLERIRLSGRHLLALIDQILDLSKIEAGHVELRIERGDLAEVLDDALTIVGPQAAAAELAVSARREAGAEHYLGDADRVRQILVNLLTNAVKFTPEGGRITVTCTPVDGPAPWQQRQHAGRWVLIEVRDTGIGIPAEKHESVFEPFVQVDAGLTRRHGGSGLGLAISRRLARLMGGDVLLESAPGAGSAFTVWLPRENPAEWENALAERARREGEGGLVEAGERIQANADAIVDAVNRSVQGLAGVPARALSKAELEDHQAAFLSALGQLLVVLPHEPPKEGLVRESIEIQDLLAARHGAQRSRLGWSEGALDAEYRLLRDETARVLPHADSPAPVVRQILETVFDRAARAAHEGWMRASKGVPEPG